MIAARPARRSAGLSVSSVGVAAAAVLLAACRGAAVTVVPEADLPSEVYISPSPPSISPTPAEATRVGIVYMVRRGRLLPVERELLQAPTRAEALLASLLSGPAGPGEQTTIPSGTRVLEIGVVGGVATVDLSREFERGAGARALALRVAQIVYTLTEDRRKIVSVVFAIEGVPSPVITADQRIVDRVGRKDYARFAPEEEPPAESGMS